MAFTKYKGGRLPAVHKPTHLCISDFLNPTRAYPSVPPYGMEFAVNPQAWGMLGNGPSSDNPPEIPDGVGDCAAAGIMHLLQAQSANTGNPLHATTAQTLALYSAVTGFSLADPINTDQGTVLTDLLDYIQRHGVEMTDARGKTVTVEVAGWAALDTTSLLQARWATRTFGGRYTGINCPEKCEEDTANWNFAGGLPIAGGHCVPEVGEGSAGGKDVSWGLVIPTSNRFKLSYIDEAYVVITKAWINTQGVSPTGLDMNGLLASARQYGLTIS